MKHHKNDLNSLEIINAHETALPKRGVYRLFKGVRYYVTAAFEKPFNTELNIPRIRTCNFACRCYATQ